MVIGEAENGAGEGDEVVACSICLEAVKIGGDRSTALLQCRHRFHLDCIGSAFNVRGVMQCPNCRDIENGSWLYVNGTNPPSDISGDELIHYELEDHHNLGYSEIPVGLHWCPFGRVARFPSSFEPGASSSSVHSLVPSYLRAQGRSIHHHDQYHNMQSAPGSVAMGMPEPQGLRSINGTPLSPPNQTGYFLFPPTSSSGQSSIPSENVVRHHSYTWVCERFAPYPLVPVHMESRRWRSFHCPTFSSESSFVCPYI